MAIIKYTWRDIPEDSLLEYELFKTGRDMILTEFIDNIIANSSNEELQDTFIEYMDILGRAMLMFDVMKQQSDNVIAVIEKLNEKPENQTKNPKIAKLIEDVLHDINLTFTNFYILIGNAESEFMPDFGLTENQLIKKIKEANNNIKPKLEILFNEALNFDQYYEELNYLCERYFNPEASK